MVQPHPPGSALTPASFTSARILLLANASLNVLATPRAESPRVRLCGIVLDEVSASAGCTVGRPDSARRGTTSAAVNISVHPGIIISNSRPQYSIPKDAAD